MKGFGSGAKSTKRARAGGFWACLPIFDSSGEANEPSQVSCKQSPDLPARWKPRGSMGIT